MKHFKLEEFKCRCGCTIPEEAKANLTALIEQVLDPAREKLGRPIFVNSGYRCLKHNQKVGGATNSQHTKGEAADIIASSTNRHQNYLLGRLIASLGNFDQIIFEDTGRQDLLPEWIHVSWKRNGNNRHSQLIAQRVNGKTTYISAN